MSDNAEIEFLPLEAVWSDERADQTQVILKHNASGYTRFNAGDIVSPKVTPTFQAGRSMITNHAGVGTTELHVLRARDGVDSRWICYALKSNGYLQEGVTAFQGVAGLQRVPANFVATFRVANCNIEDQQRIADFLDDRVTRIDKIIAARRQQVALYEGMRRRQLSDLLVTPSDGWTKGPLRRFMISEDYRRIPLSAEERTNQHGTFPYYGASGVIDYVDDLLFSEPRVLLSEDGANLLMRSTPISFVAKGKYWVNNHAHVLRPLDEAYDFWAARIEAMEIDSWISGSAQPKLTIEAAMSLPVSAPKNLDARIDLGEEVKRIETEISTITTNLLKQIDLLQEYKQSLITAAVTGELDVTTASTKVSG